MTNDILGLQHISQLGQPDRLLAQSPRRLVANCAQWRHAGRVDTLDRAHEVQLR
jgi:hypothetical protein